MKIHHIGHAGFIVETGGTRILIDPFFNPAFVGTSRPNPDNEHLRHVVQRGEFGFLYISHGHPDHFDPEFLRGMAHPPAMTLCAPFMDKDLQAIWGRGTAPGAIEADGGDLRFTVIADDWRQDSMLLLEAEGKRILFANDCNTDQCEWPKDIDVLACQYSGASYYPCMFDYPPDRMAYDVLHAREKQLDSLVAKVRLCGAKALIPCGGPMWIAGVPIGRDTMFPVWDEIEPEFKRLCHDVQVIRDGIMFARPDVTVRMETVSFPGFVEFTMPAWLHDKVATREIGWEEALLTFQVRVRREPDVFDPKLIYPLRGRAVDPPARPC